MKKIPMSLIVFLMSIFVTGGLTLAINTGILNPLTATASTSETIACNPNVELVQNGSFESPSVASGAWNIFSSVAGWNTDWFGGSASFNSVSRPEPANLEIQNLLSGWLPSEGSQYAELDTDWDGPAGTLEGEPASVAISQNIPTVSGTNYRVTFDFSPRPTVTDANDNKVEALWDSNPGTIAGPTAGNGTATSWTPYTFDFNATSASTLITLRDAGTPNSVGSFVDNVSVRCVLPITPPTTYSVTFDSNGGTPTPSPVTGITLGNTITLPTPPTRTGFTFTGWNTAANGSGAAFTISTPVTTNITAYAQWTANGEENNPRCSDGIDNDGDGKIDAADPGCHSDGNPQNTGSYTPNGPSEVDPTDVCSNIEGIQTSVPSGMTASNGNCTTPSGGGGGGGSGGYVQCADKKDNDGDGLIDDADPGCHSDGNPNNPNSYVPSDPSEQDSPAIGTPSGQVLGASTSCGIYLDKYLQMGRKNDPASVKKLQKFLNNYLDAKLKVDGIFGPKTDKYVRIFQSSHQKNVLDPWGLKGATGIVYLTTTTEINNIMCPTLNLPIPTNLIPTNANPAFPQSL